MGANVDDDRRAGSSSTLPAPTTSELIGDAVFGHSFDARSILRRNPEAADDRSTVVDLAYEEYCRKKDAGASIDIHQFASRFPDIEQSLIRVLEVHEYLEQNPDSTFAEFTPQWPEVGDEFLGFYLLAELGRGAFSRVFLAEEIELGSRQVVVKVCEYANGEAARLGQLDHQNIVPVHSVRTQVPGGLTAICMPYLANATLQHVMEEAFRDGQVPAHGALLLTAAEQTNGPNAPPVEDGDVPRAIRRGSYGDAVIELGAQMCDALAFSHAKGILHCDIKPSNVLLTAKGQSKLFDFNLSRQRGVDEQTIGGTLPYMAPEQVRCLLDTEIDPAPSLGPHSDLFSLGVTLFQLLTGRLPFEVEERTGSKRRDATDLLAKQRAGVASVVELEKVVDSSTSALILSCLAFEPEVRPRSAESLGRDLRARLSTLPRAQRWIRSHKIMTAVVALLVFVVAATGGLWIATRPPLAIREFEAACDASMQGDADAAYRYICGAIDAGYEPLDEALVLRGLFQWQRAENHGLDDDQRALLRSKAFNDFLDAFDRTGIDEAALCLAHYQLQPNRGDYGLALTRFGDRLDRGFRTPSLLNNFAICLFKKKRYEQAVATLTEAISLAPDEPTLHFNLAVVECVQIMNSQANAAGTHIQRAISHIELARQKPAGPTGPRPFEVEYRVACIFAAAAVRTPGEAGNDYQQLALASCEKAVELGLPPEALDAIASYSRPYTLGSESRLEDNEAFKQLRNKESSSRENVRKVIPMDISDDIIGRLIASR
jgi:tetratricopeptide (TPR) repeat protein